MKYRDKPYYRSKPISSLDALAKTLGLRTSTLVFLSNNTSNHYISFLHRNDKGKVRHLHDPKPIMKIIQKRINERIFCNVDYPVYLQGGIKDSENPRDYYNNASQHVLSKNIIALDIRNFYDNIKIDDTIKIFQYLFKFPQDVSSVLARLVCLNDRIPQGGVTSSYIANLIFWDKEYKLVERLRKNGLTYTRLLDDVTISSHKKIQNTDIEIYIKQIAGMLRQKGFRLNNKKTQILNNSTPMKVTGLWVNHKTPKCSRKERKQIRSAVAQCVQNFNNGEAETNSYHKLWNVTSGRVAKIERVGHPQAKKLRNILITVYPEISQDRINTMWDVIHKYEKLSSKQKRYPYQIKRINTVRYYCGILGRKNKKKAKSILHKINSLNVPAYKEAKDYIS